MEELWMQRKSGRLKNDHAQVSLEDILEAKEQRAVLQQEIRKRWQTPLVSITVNMPGSVKYTGDTVSLLYTVLDKLRGLLGAFELELKEERICHFKTGPVALLAIAGEAAQLKKIGIKLEEELPYGRLIDFDVFDAEGQQFSRETTGQPRRCFLCDQPAVVCMRSRNHSREEVENGVKQLFYVYQAAATQVLPAAVEAIGRTALEAMLVEVACTPAPGLVDRHNSGAHQDMDFFSFVLSSSAISPSLYRCALAGWRHEGPPSALLPVLRLIGRKAERLMFAATGGVNTQKGLVFLMGVLTAAAAFCVRRDGIAAAHDVLSIAARICEGVVSRELGVLADVRPGRKLTAGERLYLQYGITGIRGEVEAGLPSVRQKGLPALREALAASLSLNDALVHTLMALMAATKDTTILNRHDLTMLEFAQQQAKQACAAGGMLTDTGRQMIQQMDELFIAQNISPGGAADLLAVTYFLHKLEILHF